MEESCTLGRNNPKSPGMIWEESCPLVSSWPRAGITIGCSRRHQDGFLEPTCCISKHSKQVSWNIRYHCYKFGKHTPQNLSTKGLRAMWCARACTETSGNQSVWLTCSSRGGFFEDNAGVADLTHAQFPGYSFTVTWLCLLVTSQWLLTCR